MKNPFKFGGVVSGELFCNRTKELKFLKQAAENGDKIFLYSERRLGKTSLLKKLEKSLSSKEYTVVFIDLWPTEGELSFVLTMAKALSEATATTTDKLLETAKSFFSSLLPAVKMDDEGKPYVSFDLNKAKMEKPMLDEILNSPQNIMKKLDKKLVVVFDEFQQILEYETDIVERTLRSVIQNHEDICYIFCGSKKHLIKKMFLDSNRPLYRAGTHYPIQLIELKHWIPFIGKKFSKANKIISNNIIRKIIAMTEGHPFYTQHLCHPIWERCEEGKEVTSKLVDEAVKTVLDRETYAYSALWDSFSKGEKRLLKGLADNEKNTRIYSSEFVQKYRLHSASSVQRSVGKLLRRDVLEKDSDTVIIVDRFFRLWIKKMKG